MNIIVVHTKRSSYPNTINVGRPSVLGNPYSHLPHAKNTTLTSSVEESVQRYKEWLSNKINTSITVCDALNHIILTGRKHGTVHLACWCKDETKPLPSDHVCHADVIRNVIMTKLSEEGSD